MTSEIPIDSLVEMLRLVASESDTQQKVLPKFVCVPDEIVMLFEDAFLVYEGHFKANEEFSHEFEKLNGLFNWMRNSEKDFLTISSLEKDEAWNEARLIARRALVAIGAEMLPPKLSPTIQYVEQQNGN